MTIKKVSSTEKIEQILKNQELILNAIQILYKSLFSSDDKVDKLANLQQENQILLKKLLSSYDSINEQFKSLQ